MPEIQYTRMRNFNHLSEDEEHAAFDLSKLVRGKSWGNAALQDLQSSLEDFHFSFEDFHSSFEDFQPSRYSSHLAQEFIQLGQNLTRLVNCISWSLYHGELEIEEEWGMHCIALVR